MNTYILINRDGTHNEVPFLIINGREFVTSHFSRDELDRGHCSKPVFFKPTLELIEAIRIKTGAYSGNSGFRSHQQQIEIYQEDMQKNHGKPSGAVAKPGSSPHEYGFAVDCGLPHGMVAEVFQKIARETSIELGFGPCRRGWVMYHGVFVHLDTAYLVKDLNIDKPNPWPVYDWAPDVTW